MAKTIFVFTIFLSCICYTLSAPRYLSLNEATNAISKSTENYLLHIINQAIRQSNIKEYPDSIVFLWDSNKKSSTSTHLSGRSQNDGRKINHESRRRSKRHPEWGWFALTRRLRSRALAEHTDREFRRRINSQQATQAPRT